MTTHTSPPVLAPEVEIFDELLVGVCQELQITQTQYQAAENHYRAVGTWLSAEGSLLASRAPDIYPQGSMALQTTVKPLGQDEYDLDFVLEVMARDLTAMELYRLVESRLRDSDLYRPKLETLKRCLRINYAGDFHLDIIPARQDDRRGDSCIEVPDRKLHDWSPSNPRGFIAWFEDRCRLRVTRMVAAEQAPLPPNDEATDRAPLKRIVQLIKRRRDIVFEGADQAPRSVLLTTLAGHAYEGQESVAEGLASTLATIDSLIRRHAPGRLEVVNPTNPDERFSESWKTDEDYAAFTSFIGRFRAELEVLLATRGVSEIQDRLGALFGTTVAGRSVSAYLDRVNTARRHGLRFSTTTGIGTSAATRAVPSNTFYGEDFDDDGRRT